MIRRFLLFCVSRSFPVLPGKVAQFFYNLLVLYRAVTQNVKPRRTFLLYTVHVYEYMTCVGPPTTVFLPIICCWQTLFGKSWVMDQTTSRSCFQGSIKKNSWHPPLLNSGVRWKRYRASAVCSAVRNPMANFFLKRGFGENIDFGPFFQFEKNLGWEHLGGGSCQ